MTCLESSCFSNFRIEVNGKENKMNRELVAFFVIIGIFITIVRIIYLSCCAMLFCVKLYYIIFSMLLYYIMFRVCGNP